MNKSQEYLANRVNTASQAQLHLMLIEGGIRFAREAASRFEANDVDGASQPLRQAMDIASELMASVRHSETEINTKLASLYQFVFTRLTMAFVNTDRQKLAEAIGVLDVQRETWQMACKKAAGATDDAPSASGKPNGPHQPIVAPAIDTAPQGGLSLEA